MRSPSAHFVERDRLTNLLTELAKSPVILVAAPAGSGKTALATQWLAQEGGAKAWLALEDSDDDVVAFWTGVMRALDESVPGLGTEALNLLRQPHGVADAVQSLSAAFGAGDHPVVRLVIDDLHLVDSNIEIMRSLKSLIDRMPDRFVMLLLSRRVPELPVERLQARGQLAQVRFQELRFSQPEAVEMLTRLAPAMPDDDIARATERSDGWAAALQLSALAARSTWAQTGNDSPWGEHDRIVDHYIWREVFDAEDPAVIDTLLDTCVVDRINPSLAEALTGRAGATDDLFRAESRGLFIQQLDAHAWYEVHSLVRRMLRNELETLAPQRLIAQHARAARWFEEAGELTAALDHWLAAELPQEALRLLSANAAVLYDTGREATIRRVMGSIPITVATSDITAMMQYAWCHMLVDVAGYVDAVSQASLAAESAEVDSGVRARLAMLEAVALTLTGDWGQGRVKVAESLARRVSGFRHDAVGRFAWNLVARGIALSDSWDDASDEVDEVRSTLASDAERQVAFEGTRALGLALAGRPIDAVRVAAGVRRVADVANMTILRAEISLAEALARRELGDGRAAAELIALIGSATGPVTYSRAFAGVALAEHYLALGDLGRARGTFVELEDWLALELRGVDARSRLATLGTRLALAENDLALAQRWVDEIEDDFWQPLSQARVNVASGEPQEALNQLESVDPRCVRHQVIRDLLRARADPSRDAADKAAAAAIGAAAAAGIVQTVVDEGPAVIELVERGAWNAPQAWVDRWRRLAAAEPQMPVGTYVLIDELTEREREVLRLLPSRLTLREIADELYVSLNTLKFHVRSIYRKLEVNSRADAVESARALRRATPPGRHLPR